MLDFLKIQIDGEMVKQLGAQIESIARRYLAKDRKSFKLEACFPSSEYSKFAEISSNAHALLRLLQYNELRIQDFKLAMDELISNAVRHGSRIESDKIRISIWINQEYIQIVVKQRMKFDLDTVLIKNRLEEERHGELPSKGLAILLRLTDSNLICSDGYNVKCILTKERVNVKIS
jgi:anti-sigma regulatory factor (Ser/Thr protein kinase)